MPKNFGELPHELMALANQERVNLIRFFPIGEIVSPPGHAVLRSREAMLRISKMLSEGDSRSLMSDPIVLSIFPEQTEDGVPHSLSVHCVDGTHRLVAGLHAREWQVVGDIPSDMLEIWIEGWAAGETSGPKPRWIPLNVARKSRISDWVDVSSHPKAKGPSAQIRADIPNDSARIPVSQRGVRIDTVLKRSMSQVVLRAVEPTDVEVFFEHQLDDEAQRMAAFTSPDPGDRAVFFERWNRILSDPEMVKRTVVVGSSVAGHVVRFERFDKPEVTYWIAKEWWGRGIATAALTLFLAEHTERPLYARAAADNTGSLRVLEKCGFKIAGHERAFAKARGEEIEEVLLSLA